MVGRSRRRGAVKLVLKKKPKVKRTAGMRAGMSRAKIVEGAAKVWLSGGADNFSIRAVANALEVAPATIRAHFKGGMGELLVQIVSHALVDLTPPYKPHQDAKDYLRDFFRAALAAFRQNPELGRLVVIHLSNNPLLSPVFAERTCATLAAIAKKQNVAWALRVFLERIAGLIMIETSNWSLRKPQDVEADVLKQTSSLSPTEFPTLKLAGHKLALHLTKSAAASELDKVADAAAEALITELAKSGP